MIKYSNTIKSLFYNIIEAPHMSEIPSHHGETIIHYEYIIIIIIINIIENNIIAENDVILRKNFCSFIT